jgi:RING finger protein 113A
MREDYKAGWQIEREWEIKNREDDPPRDAGGVSRDADTATSRADSGIPDTCPICQGEFKSPVVTQCCHYFCEKCFLAKHKKKQNCFVCGKNTNGVCKPFKR